jgi:hypothetical protein
MRQAAGDNLRDNPKLANPGTRIPVARFLCCVSESRCENATFHGVNYQFMSLFSRVIFCVLSPAPPHFCKTSQKPDFDQWQAHCFCTDCETPRMRRCKVNLTDWYAQTF